MTAVSVDFYTAIVTITVEGNLPAEFHQHLTDLLADLRARGAVAPYGGALYLRQVLDVSSLGLQVRAGPRVPVFTQPDRDKPYLKRGAQVSITDRRALGIRAIHTDGWLLIWREQWVRIEDCEPIP